jgi:Fe-S cluster biogenesis protein NfuA
MFIQTERTPNPATLKFLPGRDVMMHGTANFPDAASASNSPLATALFDLEDVTGVFLAQDFITVTKAESVGDWQELKPQVMAAIMRHFTSGAPVIVDNPKADAASGPATYDLQDQDIVDQIEAILEEKVRPAVARDGGDIVFHGFKEGIVYLAMQGSCSGCPSSTMTLKNGIESLLKHYVPEVVDVRAI